MCFRIKKLSLGNYSLKQNKTNIHTYTQNKLKPLILKMSLPASDLHCEVACLRFRLLILTDSLQGVQLRVHEQMATALGERAVGLAFPQLQHSTFTSKGQPALQDR